MEMMAIPGRSGEEVAVADFIRSQLAGAGIEATELRSDDANRRTPLGGEIGNLILKLPGTVRGPRRMLSAHIDTVPVCLGSPRCGKVAESCRRTRRRGWVRTTGRVPRCC